MTNVPDGASLPLPGARPVPPTNPNYNHKLNQMTQIGKNTGSLPSKLKSWLTEKYIPGETTRSLIKLITLNYFTLDLPALFNHPVPPNPSNYPQDQHPPSQSLSSSNPYHQG